MKRIMVILMLFAVAAQAEDRLLNKLYGDGIARHVGDLVTVEIEEQSSVSKDAANSQGKKTSGDMGFNFPGMQANGSDMWGALKLPEWSIDGSKSYDSSGSKASSDNFSASITVHITEELPNGNLMISGDRKVNIDGDIIQFTLTGMVRPDDINRQNAVLSSRIAGAAITYKTTGDFSRNDKKGIFSRALDWIMPF